MQRLFFSIIFVFLLQVQPCLGQVFDNITGECEYKNVPYATAVKIATENAKKKAVETISGVDVSVYSIVKSDGKNDSHKMKTVSNAGALVKVFSKDISTKRNLVTVTISGEVIKPEYNTPISIQSIKNVYTSDDKISFGVSFYENSYLKIFWFDEETGNGGLLYPQPGRQTKKFYENEWYGFPFNDDTNYFGMICPWLKTMEEKYNEWITNGHVLAQTRTDRDLPKLRNAGGGKWVSRGNERDKNIEKNILIVFVATEHNIPFEDNVVNEETFLDWWCALPMRERMLPIKKHVTLKI